MKETYIILLLSGLLISNALACKFIPDERSFDVRIKESPVAFVGSVLSVSEDRDVVFDVERWINGGPGKTVTIKTSGTSCDNYYMVGDKWIYGGTSLLSPSQLLERPGAKEIELITKDKPDDSTRLSDAHLGIPADAQICTKNSDCKPLYYGCSSTATNGLSNDIERTIQQQFGDPRAVNCENINAYGEAKCVNLQCGIWVRKGAGRVF